MSETPNDPNPDQAPQPKSNDEPEGPPEAEAPSSSQALSESDSGRADELSQGELSQEAQPEAESSTMLEVAPEEKTDSDPESVASEPGPQDAGVISTETESHSRNAQKLWLFRLAALLIPLLLIEGGSRLYWSIAIFQFSSEEDTQNELFFKGKWDKKLPYVFTPDTDSKVAKTPTHINNIGFRGDEDVDVNARYRGLRVLCVGDSVTFGYCVSGNKAAYPAVLEQRIRSRKIPCQVINGGMPRYRSDHLRFMFEQSLPLLRPQVFIILGGWNDLNDHVLRPKSRGASSLGTLRDHLYLVKVLAEWKRRGWFSSGRIRARIRAEGYDEYREHLAALILAAKAVGSKVYICTLPHFYGSADSADAKAKAALFSPWGTLEQINMVVDVMNETIRDLATAQKVGLIELTAINDSKDFEDAIHPNDTGSAKIADIIYDRLRVDLFKK